MNEERLLKLKDVKDYIPFSTAKIYALINKNEFPKPIKIGGSALWKLTDISAYIGKHVELNKQ